VAVVNDVSYHCPSELWKAILYGEIPRQRLQILDIELNSLHHESLLRQDSRVIGIELANLNGLEHLNCLQI